MGQLLTPETHEVFANYLLAGYVVIFVRSAFVSGLRPKPADLLNEAVIFYLAIQFILLAIETTYFGALSAYFEAQTPKALDAPSPLFAIAFQVLIILIALGFIMGRFLKSDWRNGILQRLSLPVIYPGIRAHDFAFGSERTPGLVEITFEVGTKVAGWFGEKSLASTDDPRSDLYLERAYAIDHAGDWKEPKTPRAILISLSNVRSVEFLLPKEGS